MASLPKIEALLVQTAQDLTPSSGGYKPNYNLLCQLNRLGHKAAQICYGYEQEVKDYAKRAADSGIKPDVSQEILSLDGSDAINLALGNEDDLNDDHKLANGNSKLGLNEEATTVPNQLIVDTFTDQDEIQNYVIRREPFNAAYPVLEFFKETREYLEVVFGSPPPLSSLRAYIYLLVSQIITPHYS